MRRILGLLISLLVLAPAAQAAPRPLMTLGEHEDVALAGDRVLFTHTRGNTVEVRALPLAGGAPLTVFSVTLAAPAGFKTPDDIRLTASWQRAVLFVAYDNSISFYWDQTQVFAGTPTGDWAPVTPMRDLDHLPLAGDAYAEDGRIIAVEKFKDDGVNDYQVVSYDPARQVLDGVEEGDRLAGDLVASTVGATLRGGVHARRVIVTNRRTGQVLTDEKLIDHVQDLALRPDGTVFFTHLGRIRELTPGATSPHDLARDARYPTVSGDRLVFARPDGLRVREANGQTRAFGIPTANPGPPQADAANVLWRANGCVLVAAITDPPASEPGPGPCARAELSLVRGNRKTGRVRLRCVAAPAEGCRGAVQLRADDRAASRAQTIRLTAGESRTLRLKLTRRIGLDAQVFITPPGGKRTLLAQL